MQYLFIVLSMVALGYATDFASPLGLVPALVVLRFLPRTGYKALLVIAALYGIGMGAYTGFDRRQRQEWHDKRQAVLSTIEGKYFTYPDPADIEFDIDRDILIWRGSFSFPTPKGFSVKREIGVIENATLYYTFQKGSDNDLDLIISEPQSDDLEYQENVQSHLYRQATGKAGTVEKIDQHSNIDVYNGVIHYTPTCLVASTTAYAKKSYFLGYNAFIKKKDKYYRMSFSPSTTIASTKKE